MSLCCTTQILHWNEIEEDSFSTVVWKKDKMPVTSIFSFSNGIFYLMLDIQKFWNAHLNCTCKRFPSKRTLQFIIEYKKKWTLYHTTKSYICQNPNKVLWRCQNQFNVAQAVEVIFDRVENIFGKRRKCWLPAFSPFPENVFQTILSHAP